MKRHTKTVPHCNTEALRGERDEEDHLFRKRLKGGLTDAVRVNEVAVTTLSVFQTHFQARTLHWKCVDMLELSNFACACMSFAQGHVIDQPHWSHLHFHIHKTTLLESRQQVNGPMCSFCFSLFLPCFLRCRLDKLCCMRWTAGLSLCLLYYSKHWTFALFLLSHAAPFLETCLHGLLSYESHFNCSASSPKIMEV